MVIFRKIRRKLKRLFSRKPVVESDILLIAPFDAERQQLGDALLRYLVGNNQARFDADAKGLVEIPLGGDGERVLFSLTGFQEIDARSSRALLGLSAAESLRALLGLSDTAEESYQAHFGAQQRLRIANAVCMVCIDLAMTPLDYDTLSADMAGLRKTFGERLVCVGINVEKLQKWNAASLHKRQEIWQGLLGESLLIKCPLDEDESAGMEKLIAAIAA